MISPIAVQTMLTNRADEIRYKLEVNHNWLPLKWDRSTSVVRGETMYWCIAGANGGPTRQGI